MDKTTLNKYVSDHLHFHSIEGTFTLMHEIEGEKYSYYYFRVDVYEGLWHDIIVCYKEFDQTATVFISNDQSRTKFV